MAMAAALGIPANASADMVREIIDEIKTHQVHWKTMDSPSPGIRAFEGTSKLYRLLVAQANVKAQGLIHRGTAIALKPRAFNILVLPPEVADFAYHVAAANSN